MGQQPCLYECAVCDHTEGTRVHGDVKLRVQWECLCSVMWSSHERAHELKDNPASTYTGRRISRESKSLTWHVPRVGCYIDELCAQNSRIHGHETQLLLNVARFGGDLGQFGRTPGSRYAPPSMDPCDTTDIICKTAVYSYTKPFFTRDPSPHLSLAVCMRLYRLNRVVSEAV